MSSQKSHMKNITLIIILVFINSFCGTVFANQFRITPLPKALQADLIISGIWRPGCPVSLANLRLISVSYYDLLGHVHHDGQLIVNKSAAANTLNVFKQLYAKKFPFSAIETLVTYKGNIQLAEEKNVTYGFVCRQNGQNNFAASSFGTVLTINPTFNPDIKYIKDKKNQYVIISPHTAIFSINRSLKLPGMSESISAHLTKNHFLPVDRKANEIGWKQFVFSKDNGANSHAHQLSSLRKKPASPFKPMFTYGPLSSEMKKNLKKSGAWFEGCPVPLNRLSLLTLSYYGFDKKVHTGTLIMFDAIAPYAAAAFKELYHRHFPLEKFDVFNAPEYENTSAFNCRNIVGQHHYSVHAYGLAIDINVSRNPYVGIYKKTHDGQMIGSFVPTLPSSISYLDRSKKRAGMNESIVQILAKYGFTEWGGHWQDTVDYMHFQVPTKIAMYLTTLDKPSAEQVIALVIKYPEAAKRMSTDSRWTYLYKIYSSRYIKVLKKYFPLLQTKDEGEVTRLIYRDLAIT